MITAMREKLSQMIKPAPAELPEVTMEQSSLGSVGSLLDYVNATGFDDLLDFYSFGTGIRNMAVSYATLYRCISLLSSVAAQQLTQGNIRIVDNDHKIVRSKQAKIIEDKFNSSVDGGRSASFTWFEDWMTEYLLDGNALAKIHKGPNNSFGYLERLISWDAEAVDTRSGMDFTYRARTADNLLAEYRLHGRRTIAHARWPRVIRLSGGTSHRSRFAYSPITLMRPAVEIGLRSDQFIKRWFEDGGSHRSQLGISFQQPLSAQQRTEITKYLADRKRGSREPVVMGQGAIFTNLQNNAATQTQLDLRKFQVEELGRIYGVPAPILNDNITQWGGGIEALVKMFWRFGARQHIERLLAPLQLAMLPPGQRFMMDDTDILRGDVTAIAALITATTGDAQRMPIVTTEEARRWTGLPIKPEYGDLTDRVMQQPQTESMTTDEQQSTAPEEPSNRGAMR